MRKKMEMLKSHLQKKEVWSAYAQIILGCVLGAAAYPLFITPNNIAPGGVTGVAVILNYLFHLPVGTISLILNIPLFLIGYRSMGSIFAFRSLIATILFSVWIDILPLEAMTMDPLLGTVFGGVLLGLGLGLILRGSATTGGTDMIARLVHKRFEFISTGTFLFIFDFLVVVCAAFLIGTTQALYATINIYVTSRVIDSIMVGFSGNKACLIISSSWEKIRQRILSEVNRGVTELSARGGYTGEERPTLLCVLSRQEIALLKNIVQEEDKKAFMIIMEAHEAIGDGFSGMHDKL